MDAKVLMGSGHKIVLFTLPFLPAVAFLVLPGIGLLLGSWLGVLIGIVLYVGSRLYSPQEEKTLAETFGDSWDEYCERVKIPWL